MRLPSRTLTVVAVIEGCRASPAMNLATFSASSPNLVQRPISACISSGDGWDAGSSLKSSSMYFMAIVLSVGLESRFQLPDERDYRKRTEIGAKFLGNFRFVKLRSA